MRVLIHAPAARMGGARTHLLGLVPELARLRPRDHFLLVGQPELLGDLAALPATWELRAEQPQRRGLAGRLAWEQTGLPRLERSWRADVMLSFGSFVPLRRGVPRVLEAGNALPFSPAYWRTLRRERSVALGEELARWVLLQASLRASARVLVPSRSMRQDVVQRLPDLASRVDVALWGVPEAFHRARWAPNDSRQILGVSKHGINKEFDVLVAAFARLSQRWPRLRLALTGTAGESRWSRRTAALIQDLGVGGRVRWLGDVPNQQVPGQIAASEVLVFPTWCESFGLPLAEALAMGAPAVAGDIPACREVGGEGARFYRPGRVDSLVEALEPLLEDPRGAAELGVRGRERGQGFTWRANAEVVWATLERAAAGAA